MDSGFCIGVRALKTLILDIKDPVYRQVEMDYQVVT